MQSIQNTELHEFHERLKLDAQLLQRKRGKCRKMAALESLVPCLVRTILEANYEALLMRTVSIDFQSVRDVSGDAERVPALHRNGARRPEEQQTAARPRSPVSLSFLNKRAVCVHPQVGPLTQKMDNRCVNVPGKKLRQPGRCTWSGTEPVIDRGAGQSR